MWRPTEASSARHRRTPPHPGLRSAKQRPKSTPRLRLQNDGRATRIQVTPDSITGTGHFQRRVQADYDAASDKMPPEHSRNRGGGGGAREIKRLSISRGHSELKVNVPERSSQSEAHCPVRLKRARDRGARHCEGFWGLKSLIQPSLQCCRTGPESGTTTPSR